MFENMTSREKTLAMIVGALLPIGLLFFGFTWFMDNYDRNNSEIDDLMSQVETQQMILDRGNAAAARRSYYRKVSLPEKNRTRNIYKAWLDDLVLKETGMTYSGVRMKAAGSLGYQRSEVASRSVFTLRPKGTLNQLIKLLHGFYSADHLHRINKLTIKPEAVSKRGKDPVLTGQLLCELEIETLSLVDGPARLPSFPVWKKELPTVDAFTKQILARNVFGPANNTPSLEKPSTSKVQFVISKDSNVSGYETVKVSAKDADADDILAFEILETSGQDNNFGIKLGEQPRTASQRQISLQIPKQAEPVRIPVSMRVYDDGLPAKEGTIDFTVSFVAPKKDKPKKPDPPPKPIVFAKVTFVRGLTRVNGQWAAIIYSQLTGEKHSLGTGETLKVDDVPWKVVEIDSETVTFEVDGKRRSYEPGSSLDEPMTAL
jgi:hypothetical protein